MLFYRSGERRCRMEETAKTATITTATLICGTPCQHLERIRSHQSQQDYPRKFSDYSRYSKKPSQITTNAKALYGLDFTPGA